VRIGGASALPGPKSRTWGAARSNCEGRHCACLNLACEVVPGVAAFGLIIKPCEEHRVLGNATGWAGTQGTKQGVWVHGGTSEEDARRCTAHAAYATRSWGGCRRSQEALETPGRAVQSSH
jgi:hypothetical protein